jgi:ribosomal protein S26
METKKPCCPNCRSENLIVIGAVILNSTGVLIEEKDSLLKRKDTRISHEMLRCLNCSTETTLLKAKEAAGIPLTGIYWEKNRYGLPVPVKCASCGNTEHFSRAVKQLVDNRVQVEIKDGQVVSEETGADPLVLDSATTAYFCADCDTEILIDEREFDLVPS